MGKIGLVGIKGVMMFDFSASLKPFLDMTGYEPKTTFWMDFSIADRFGVSAVKDTFKRAFNEWKTDYVYLTELVMMLNWKIWQHHDMGRMDLAKVYDELWREADQWALENLKDEEKAYYIQVLD